MDNLGHLFIRAYKDDLLDAVSHVALKQPLRDPKELTELQRLAVAYLAGCQIDYIDGELRSRKKLGFALIDGKYNVYESMEDATRYDAA